MEHKGKRKIKRFCDYTDEEILKDIEKTCMRCRYGEKVSGMFRRSKNDVQTVICGYLLKTGKRRGCDPMHCTKFEPVK